MKLDSSLNTETNCTLKETSFSIKASPIAFDILSSKLYSDPILAIVRELLCNAYDSHVVAGTTDIPIDITFPNNLENTFIIRDYGTGLSKESIYELYTTFFGSNKSNSNDLTGGFGLGSKTPFAYTTSFSVTSYYNGIESRYLVTKKDGYPTIYEISDTSTTEHNGLKIVIPISKDNYDNNKFFTAFQNYIYYIPEIKVNSNAQYCRGIKIYQKDNITCYKAKNPYKNDYIIFIKQGQNVYRINTSKYVEYDKLNILSDINSYLDVVIEVPIGTIGITPNREQLSVEDKDYKTVYDILIKCINTFTTNFESFIEVLRKSSIDNTQNLVTRFYNNKYLKNTDLELINKYNNIYIRVSCQFIFDLYTLNDDNTIDIDYCYQLFCCNEEENIIILANDRKEKSNIRKLQNIIKNYSNELKDKYIHVFYINNTLETINKYNSKPLSSLQVVRNLYNYIWYMNNISNYNCNISCMSMSKFLRMYPNHKMKRTKKKKINLNNTYITCSDFKFSDNSCQTYINKNSYSIQCIQDMVIGNNNAIFLFEDNGDTIEDMSNYYRILYKILNLDGQYPKIIKYFKDNYNMDCTSNAINLITIAKSNKKYFKNYPTMTISQLKDLVRSIDFTVTNKECSKLSRKVYNIPKAVHYFINNTVLPKDLNLWLNSKFKKKVDLIHKLKDKYLNNYIADYDNEIINFIGKDTKQVKQIPELPEITCKNMMRIYDRIYDICSTATYRKYRNILLKQLRSNYAVF